MRAATISRQCSEITRWLRFLKISALLVLLQRLTLPAQPGAKPVVLDDGKKLSDFNLKVGVHLGRLAPQPSQV